MCDALQISLSLGWRFPNKNLKAHRTQLFTAFLAAPAARLGSAGNLTASTRQPGRFCPAPGLSPDGRGARWAIDNRCVSEH